MDNRSKDYWTITPMALTELINAKRKELNKTPIDHVSMKTHLIIKTNVGYPGVFDFESSELTLDAKRIDILQQVINDQFGIYLDKLSRSCEFHPAKKNQRKPVQTTAPESSEEEQKDEGFMSKLGRMLGR